MKVSILDLPRQMEKVWAALERGERVTVLYRGRARGVIRAVGGDVGVCRAAEHPAFEMWKDHAALSTGRSACSGPVALVREPGGRTSW